MRTIVNTQINGIIEFQHIHDHPYQGSDLSIGRYLTKRDVVRNFAESLLLYDRIYIVTDFFSEIIFLRNLMGGPNLEKLLRDGVIKFVQIPFKWGYIQKWKHEKGNFGMHGIVAISIADPKLRNIDTKGFGTIPENIGGLSSTDIEESATTALLQTGDWNSKKVGKFARLVAANTQQLRSKDFIGSITSCSESDLSDERFRANLDFSDQVDIDNLPDNSGDIRRLFRVVKANETVKIMQYLPEADLMGEDFFTSVLRYSLGEELRAKKLSDKADELFKIEKIPSPKQLGDIYFSIPEIIKLRSTSEAVSFRDWFHDKFNSGEDIQAAYVELLKKEIPFIYKSIFSFAQLGLDLLIPAVKVPAKIVANQLGNHAVDYVSQNILMRYIKPNPPKFFFENIQKKMLEEVRSDLSL